MPSLPDLLRLVVVPAMGWAAYRDVLTRRVPNGLWTPLAVLGAALLVWEGAIRFGGPPFVPWAIRVALSVGIVVPLAYGFWWIGGFGGADAKAFVVLAILLPTYPRYALGVTTLPVVVTDLGIFSLSVVTNAAVLSLFYPLALGVRNGASGNLSWAMFVGRPVPVEAVTEHPGTLLETPSGLSRNGLDLDALRMYLRWRGVSLRDLRADPSLRDPATLPDDPGDPTDGAVRADGSGDPWGAARFLESIDTSAYGTTPETLRGGLDVLVAAEDRVWITPGIPFVVPTLFGLVLGLTVGDLLYLVLGALGLV
ncbi:MAG: prepilin peptidase [Halanaeroarchaeum sp.]